MLWFYCYYRLQIVVRMYKLVSVSECLRRGCGSASLSQQATGNVTSSEPTFRVSGSVVTAECGIKVSSFVLQKGTEEGGEGGLTLKNKHVGA